MAGMSNVGKSSLINSIFRTDACKVSNTPGMTRSLFFYKVNSLENLVLIDAPGYGYAKRSKTEINKWEKCIEIYLKRSVFFA